MIQNTLYHSALRVISVTFALILVFDSGMIYPITKELSNNATSYLASAVSVSVGVKATEMNQLTARITELENELAVAQEEREIAVNLNKSGVGDRSTLYIAITLALLLILIILNYLMDYWRSRQPSLAS